MIGILFCASCSREVSPRGEIVLGTLCTVNAFEDGTQKLNDRIFARLREIDAAFSVTNAESQISAVNREAGIQPVTVSDEVFAVVKKSLEIARLTDGAFEPTVRPLSALWGIGTDAARLPEAAEIDEARALVGFGGLVLDEDKKSVYLAQKGMALDLGGIAKGYAADEVVAILRAERVRRAVVDLGGNVYVFGTKPDGTCWNVGIRNPANPDDEPVCTLHVEEGSVVTSGVYERYLELDGRRYHHILNPATGYPVENGLLSVTVVHSSSMEADALATALFVMGLEKGLSFAESHGIDAVFIDDTLKLTPTAGFAGKFSLFFLSACVKIKDSYNQENML